MKWTPSAQDLDNWADGLVEQGIVVADAALAPEFFALLQTQATQRDYQPARIGRGHAPSAKTSDEAGADAGDVAVATQMSANNEPMRNTSIRGDDISWTQPHDPVDAAWIHWLEAVQQGLNERLFLGLSSHESHYAHYAPGTFYKKHKDGFRNPAGRANPGVTSERIVSLVLYLNRTWPPQAQGQLMTYGQQPHQVLPVPGRLVLFMSADTPHEVKAATQHRYSLVAWLRR